jgi:dienelactone hydrolase
MIAPLAKFIDWSVIQATTLREPPADGRNPRLEEALQFLKGPDFIPEESQPARVEFYPDQSGLHFRFPTPCPCDFEENNVVYGRLYRCAERWQERPVIVLLHGGNDFVSYRFRYPLIARHYNQAGFNVATLAAPYHFQRRPRQLRTLSRPDYLRSAKTHAQAVAEIRALTGWLLGQGCPGVALCGSSYGARLAGLTVCCDARLAAVVLNKPAVGANPAFAKRLFRRRLRESWLKQRATLEALNLTPFNLTLARPAIPKENILLIEAIHDLYVPKEAIEDLWQAWGQPEIWRLPHAHISLSLTPGLTGRILRWLAPRLNAPRVRTGQLTSLRH